MARIRSIKPEFWTDGSNLILSDSCALFFIGLWNFCDDEGKHKFDLNQLVAELGGRWHRGKVKLFLSCLINSGQLRLNHDSTWIQVTGWSHQKIDKPKQPEVKASELQWLSQSDSAKSLEKSRTIDARIGEDRTERSGSDLSRDTTESRIDNSSKIVPIKEKKSETDTELNKKIWEAYSNAYFSRYKTEPIRNAKINSQISQIAKRLGAEAIEVVKFYLSHNDSFYLKNLHSLGLCLNNAESLRTQWARGKAITGRDVHNFEKSTSHQNLINDILENGI